MFGSKKIVGNHPIGSVRQRGDIPVGGDEEGRHWSDKLDSVSHPMKDGLKELEPPEKYPEDPIKSRD